jgi:hypothetical protein
METFIPIQGMQECVNDTGTYVLKSDYDNLKEKYKDECSRLREEVIFGFYEDDIPVYIQGYNNGAHEITEIVTAEEVTVYLNMIIKLRKQLDIYKKFANNMDDFFEYSLKSLRINDLRRDTKIVLFFHRQTQIIRVL